MSATAEATTLTDHSIDMITVGQAFHWFQHDLARQEFQRILAPGGWVVLVWNLLRNNGTPFANAFDQFWLTYVAQPHSPSQERKRPDYVTRFFGEDRVMEKGLDNYQVCDFEALKGRVLSSSRAPEVSDPRYRPMLDELAAIFDQYNEDGTVTLEYDTQVVYGQLVD